MPYKHQTPEDIINAANPAQKIIWNNLFLRFGDNIGISQFCYSGLKAGSELILYKARIMYFAYQIEHGYFQTVTNNIVGITYRNEADAPNFFACNLAPMFNSSTVQTLANCNNVKSDNILFSRFESDYSYVRFIGYKIGI